MFVRMIQIVNQPFLVGAALSDLANQVLVVPYVNMTTKSIPLKAGTMLAQATFVQDSSDPCIT
jgi:hypothetical protein